MKHLNRTAPLLLVSCLILASSPGLLRGQNRPTEPGFTEAGLKQLRALMQDAVDRKQISGAVGLLMRRGQIGFLEAVGQRDAEAGVAMTADTLFRIASMTKAVTSVAAMILVDDGRIRVEDPVSKYIPEFKDMRVLAPGTYGKDGADAQTVPAQREVTIHDLLTHTSGLVYGFSAAPPLKEQYDKLGVSDGLVQTEGTTGDNARKLASIPLAHQPGAAFTYSLGTDVLGRVVEVASGMSLDRFFRQRIFEPLKMSDTSFFLTSDRKDRLAALYEPGPDKSFKRVGEGTLKSGSVTYSASTPYRGPQTNFSGGAGLISTASDYGRFLQMLLGDGQIDGIRVLAPQTVRRMTEDRISPLHIGSADHPDGFGYGFGITQQGGSGPSSPGSFAWGGIYNTFFWVDPRKDLVGVLMTQIFPSDHMTLRDDFQKLAYKALAEPPKAEQVGAVSVEPLVAPAALRRYALEHQGNAERGKLIFGSRQTSSCQTCHRARGIGGDIGPDLTDIGNKFERAHLIESVLEPSRQIVEGFRVTALSIKSGQVLAGVVRGETDDDLTLVAADGRKQTVRKADLEARRVTDMSLMPENSAAGLSASEFTDLIAYLESLRPNRKPTPGERFSDPPSLPIGFIAARVADGLTGATALEVAPDGRVFVCEQTGTLRVVKRDVLLAEPFLELKVDSNWERGLIGVTLDPDFVSNGYVYVCYVVPEPYPHHRISRFTASGDLAVAGSELVLIEGDDQTKMGGTVPAGHQGGSLHFGRDGKLYIALGEQTAGGPAQDLHSLLGKLLRINRDGTIPADNPFVASTTGKYRSIWALGLRNPFTFAVQPGTGRIFINDVGQNTWEELNEGVAGSNYGWPVSEGPTADMRFRPPIHVYPNASIAGGAFCPTDFAWPTSYLGKYFFMDFVRGWIKVLDPEVPAHLTTFATGLAPVDLRFAPDGSLYVLLRNAWVIDREFRPGTGSLLKIRTG